MHPYCSLDFRCCILHRNSDHYLVFYGAAVSPNSLPHEFPVSAGAPRGFGAFVALPFILE
jgi:hypothetical protein